MKCEYGCGRESVYKLKNGKRCCSKNCNGCPSIRRKNSSGVKESYRKGRITSLDFSDEAKFKMGKSNRGKTRISETELFMRGSKPRSDIVHYILKKKLKDYKCDICGIDSWNDSYIVLELDHINGEKFDNRLENLRFLCPNCHSQTPTYRNRDRSGSLVSEADIKNALLETKDVYLAILKLKLKISTESFAILYFSIKNLSLEEEIL